MKRFTLSVFCLLSIGRLSAQSPVWHNIGPGGGSDLHYLAIQPDNKDVIYTAGDIEGIFKTTDGGNTWNNINNNLAQLPYGSDIYWINEIKIDPQDYQKIYICDGVGLFRSNDGGNSWQMLFPDSIDDNNNPPIETSAIGIDSVNPSRLFLGLGDEAGECAFADFQAFPGYDGPWGLYRSLDGGNTWTSVYNGLPDSLSIHTIDLIPYSDTVIIATNRGVFRSDNGGSSWTAKNTGLPHTNCYRIQVTNDYGFYVLTLTLKTLGDVNDSTTFSGGVFRSDDMGESWYDITGNLPHYDPYDSLFYDYWKFDIFPGDVDNIYIATNPGSGYDKTGVFATWDGGLYWDLLYTPLIGGWMDTAFIWEGYAYDIRIAPSDPSRFAICRDDVEISNDTGNTWHNAFTTPSGQGWQGNGLELMNTESIAFDPNDSNKLYVGYDDYGLFRSDDGANSFIRLDAHEDPIIGNIQDIDAVKDVYIDPANGDVYTERYQGSQGGQMAGFSSGGLAYSSDQGATVTDITGNLPKDGRYDVAIDFSSGTPGNRSIYAAIYHHGVYKSTDGGNTWTSINTGLGTDAPFVWDIAINPANPQELYLGINSWGGGNNGLYKSVDGGQNWTIINGLPAGDVGRVFISDAQDVYAGISDDFDWSISGGLYRSTDHGNTFTLLLNHSRITDVDVNPSNPNVILAVGQQWYTVTPSEDHGIFLSEDNGNTWNLITAQNINHTAFNFARFNPHNPKEVFAGTGGGGLWKSTLDISLETDIPSSKIDARIYPVPTKDLMNIEWKDHTGITSISLSDLSGRQIMHVPVARQASVQLDVSRMKPGMYFLHMESSEDHIVFKFVKN